MGIWSLWLFIAVGFLIAELLTMSTMCLYVGIGAFMAMCAALLGGDWLVTIVAFLISTSVIYLATYRWRHRIVKTLNKGSEHGATGMDALIGRKGTVFSAPDSFRMRIDGDIWQVRPAANDIKLAQGDEVSVVGYDSIILTVKKV